MNLYDEVDLGFIAVFTLFVVVVVIIQMMGGKDD